MIGTFRQIAESPTQPKAADMAGQIDTALTITIISIALAFVMGAIGLFLILVWVVTKRRESADRDQDDVILPPHEN